MKISNHNSHLVRCRNLLWLTVFLMLFVACANDDPVLENALNKGHITTDLGEADGFTSPEGTLLINNDNISTKQTNVQISLNANDAVSVAQYYFSDISTTPLASATGWQYLDGSNNVSAQLTASISPVEEPHSFYVWFKDSTGNISAQGTDSIIYDVTAPSITSLSIDTGNIATNSQNVTLSLTASDAVGVTGHYSSESATTPDLSAAGWTSVSSATAYSGTANFTMSSGEGTKTVYAWFRDFAGNISVADNDTIILDQSAPTGSVSINSGASSTTSRSVTLTLTATDGIGVTGYYVSNSSSTPSSSDSGWTSISSTTSFSGSASFTLSSSCGTSYAYVWFRDTMGNVSSRYSDSITLDTSCFYSFEDGSIPSEFSTSSPSWSISSSSAYSGNYSIRSGSGSNSSCIEITKVGSGTVSFYYKVQSDNYYDYLYFYVNDSRQASKNASSWRKYSKYLSSGGTLKWCFNDDYYDEDEYAFLDYISIPSRDTNSPSGSVSINSGDSYTDSYYVTLSLSATDDEGVTGYYASTSSSTPSGSDYRWTSITSTTSYSGSKSYFYLGSSQGTRTVYVWFKDAAGNVSTRYSDSITYDSSSPSGSITINNESNYTRYTTSISITVSATDSVGVTGYYVSTSSSSPLASASGWTAVSSTTSYLITGSMSISSNYGNRYVYAWFKDATGNVSSRNSASMYCSSAGSSCY